MLCFCRLKILITQYTAARNFTRKYTPAPMFFSLSFAKHFVLVMAPFTINRQTDICFERHIFSIVSPSLGNFLVDFIQVVFGLIEITKLMQ